jgi:hypothetical protein
MQTEIVGTWSLESFVIHPKEGSSRPWGEGLRGLLIYTESGHVSVSINKDVVSKSGNSDEDILDSVLFYAGTYTLQGNVIHHQVTQATSPSRIGRDMIRYAEFKNGNLNLTTPEEAFGKAVLVWKKIE